MPFAALLKRRRVSYAQLVEKLAAIGVTETEPNIRNKLARGIHRGVHAAMPRGGLALRQSACPVYSSDPACAVSRRDRIKSITSGNESMHTRPPILP